MCYQFQILSTDELNRDCSIFSCLKKINFRLQYLYCNDTFIQYLRVSEFQRQRPSIFFLTTVYLIRCQPLIHHSECSCGLPESVSTCFSRKENIRNLHLLSYYLTIYWNRFPYLICTTFDSFDQSVISYGSVSNNSNSKLGVLSNE